MTMNLRTMIRAPFNMLEIKSAARDNDVQNSVDDNVLKVLPGCESEELRERSPLFKRGSRS